jgi:lipoprotein-anchoring transpeptidase ErfK/SrfK
MDAKRTRMHYGAERAEEAAILDRRVAMPLAAALAVGLVMALVESPATAQSQGGDAPSVVIDPASLPPSTPREAPAPPVPTIMAPGDYEWDPSRSLAGDVVIVVSLPQQLVHVYRGGVRIGTSTISSGKPGHDTPTGVFTILQKQKMHHSTLYDDAPMPFMQRLTWDGVAMHAGRLPGYPASHGCIRLPAEFAEALYGVTDHDNVVIVADEIGYADDVVHPGDRLNQDVLALVARARVEEGAEVAANDAAAGAARAGTGSAAAM